VTVRTATGAQPGLDAPRREARPWWRWFLLFGLLVMAGVPLLPAVGRQIAYAPIAAVALCAGVRWHRPADPRPWYLLIAAGVTSFGGVCWWAVEFALTGDRAYPSVGDVLYTSSYPPIIGGLATWVHRCTSSPTSCSAPRRCTPRWPAPPG
jgi:di/tricarboxylate transporter